MGTSYIKAIRYLNLPTEVYMLDVDPKKRKVYNNTKMVKFLYKWYKKIKKNKSCNYFNYQNKIQLIKKIEKLNQIVGLLKS